MPTKDELQTQVDALNAANVELGDALAAANAELEKLKKSKGKGGEKFNAPDRVKHALKDIMRQKNEPLSAALAEAAMRDLI